MEKEVDQQPELTPIQKMEMRVAQRKQRMADFKATNERLKEVEEVDEAAGPTFLGETTKAVWGAGVDLVSEGMLMVADVGYSLPPVKGFHQLMTALDNPELQRVNPETGVDEVAELADSLYADWKAERRAETDALAPENETFVGSAGRGILQFLVPYTKLTAGQKVGYAGATARGFAIDYTLFDPTQGNLSNLINEMAPEHQNLVTEFLATDPDDTDAANRLKNGLEGVFLGTVLESVFRLTRWALGKKEVDAAYERADQQTTSVDDIRSQAEAEPALATAAEAPSGSAAPEVPKAPETPSAGGERVPEGDAPDAPKKADGSPDPEAPKLEDTLRDSIKMTSEQRVKFNRLILEGDDDGAAKMLQEDFNLDTFDWENIQSADDIKKIINVTSEVMAEHIDDVKGGVQSHEQTKRLGNLVGLTGEKAHELFKDLRTGPGVAARFHAAQRTMLASAKEVYRLAKVARESTDPKDKANLFRQIELHAALQAEVKGAQTEIARALNGMAILKQESESGFKEFDNINRMMGGKGRSGKTFDRMVDTLLNDSKSLEEINEIARNFSRAGRVRDIFVEYVINSMLSSVKTHVINFSSNLLNTFVYSGDRLIAGSVRALAGDKAAWREAKIDLITKFSKLDEALKLARQAWKDGLPVADKAQRVEFATRKAIKMDGDTALAKTVNVFGEIVRIPGRALLTGDEFWKAINRNSELAVLAYREADASAVRKGMEIGTDAYEDHVRRMMVELLDPASNAVDARNIRAKAVERSRRVAFQESPLTPGGRKLESVINHNALIKLVIAPFFRTPMNILRQVTVDRTPFSLLIDETQDILKNGHPREKAETIARMTSGVAAMAAFWGVAGAGNDEGAFQVVGKVPYDSSEKATGVLDYSLRIGDKWYQFNRLDPMGMYLGMVADMKTHMEHNDDDAVSTQMMQGTVLAFMRNVVNKTWAKTMSDLLDLVDRAAAGKPVSAARAFDQFMADQTGKLIPQIVKSTGRVVAAGDDQFAYEAWEYTDRLNSQLPWLNEDLPKRHDALGRPISWENSKWSIINPFAISPNPDTPLEKELARLDFTVTPMPKSFGGGLLELTAEESSELTGLVGDTRMSRYGNLEETLNAIVQTDDYQAWSDERKVYAMKQLISQARGAARQRFLMDPTRQERFREAKRAEFDALLQ